jgi:predicted alpha/beta-fold hydrolase
MSGHGSIVRAPFRPAGYLNNPHVQTLWQALAPRRDTATGRKERWELPDGDFIDLIWSGPEQGPLVILLHGLEGSIDSHYIRGLRNAIERRGWRSCLMYFRNCSGEPNRLARSYHSGETGDLTALVARLRCESPSDRIAVVGFSLGGNVLLKWLGESGTDARVDAAVAVSVPMRLDLCANRMQQGFSRLYQRYLLDRMRASLRRKFRHRDDSPYPLDKLDELDSFWRFDHHITAALHGFNGVDDYYQRASSRQYLPGIHAPTLIIHAQDDPFMTPEVIPEATELSPSTTLELATHGGHVGFVHGPSQYWLDQRISGYLAEHLSTNQAQPEGREANTQ